MLPQGAATWCRLASDPAASWGCRSNIIAAASLLSLILVVEW